MWGQERSASRRGSSGHSDLRLPGSKTARNKSLLLISHPACGILLSWPERIKTEAAVSMPTSSLEFGCQLLVRLLLLKGQGWSPSWGGGAGGELTGRYRGLSTVLPNEKPLPLYAEGTGSPIWVKINILPYTRRRQGSCTISIKPWILNTISPLAYPPKCKTPAQMPFHIFFLLFPLTNGYCGWRIPSCPQTH